MKTIAIANQKGGCGKTTTAVNLSAACAMQGYRVLVLDLDPQAHATIAFGVAPSQLKVSLYHVIVNENVPMLSIVRSTDIERLDIAPSNILLSGAEMELSVRHAREAVLSKRLENVKNNYDICIIDCSPSLSILTLNALVACDEVIIPVQTHYYAIEGLKQILDSIAIVKQRFHRNLNSLRILLTCVDNRTLLSQDVERQIRECFGHAVFNTVIHICVRLAEAPSAGKSVFSYEPTCRGASEYLALSNEVFGNGSEIRTTEGSVVDI